MPRSEEKRAYNQNYYNKNREKFKAYRDAYRERTKEERNARRRALYRQDAQRREAAREAVRQQRKNHPLARRSSTYGIPRRELEAMMNQGCAICSANPLVDTSVKLHVDHNHRTGKVRGVLCSHCNLAIGHLHDDPILAAATLRYLLMEGKAHE